jgi:hypothetical protein
MSQDAVLGVLTHSGRLSKLRNGIFERLPPELSSQPAVLTQTPKPNLSQSFTARLTSGPDTKLNQRKPVYVHQPKVGDLQVGNDGEG